MRLRLSALCLAASFMAGCSSLSVGTATTPQSATAITGTVYGGQQPISGAQIQLYAVDTSGNQTPLLATTILTLTNGSFSLDTVPGTATPLYTCPTATTPVFLTAQGGNPGLTVGTNNAAIFLADALGDCGNLTPSTKISINEATTVAFAAEYYAIGAATTQAALETAFSNAAALVNPSTGVSPGTGQTSTDNGGRVPQTKIYTLADAVAACVASSGTINSTTPCGQFFAAVPYSGGAPTDTLTALINLQQQSQMAYYNNQIFMLASSTGPFQPELSAAPSDWFIQIAAVTLNGVLVANPTSGKTGDTIAVTSTNYATSNAVCPFVAPIAIVIGGQQASGTFTATQVNFVVPGTAPPGSGLGQIQTATGTCTFPFTVQ